jgi:hypothetical protein
MPRGGRAEPRRCDVTAERPAVLSAMLSVMRFRSLAVAVLGATLSAQQTKVLPAGMDRVEGQISFGFLFSRPDADFFLLYDADQVTTGQAQLTGLDFRQNQQTSPVAGFTKPYRVTAYTVPMNAAGMIALGSVVSVATIVGSATGTVVMQSPVVLPARSSLSVAPGPFDINFPFSVPYTFDATQGNLLLRIQATDSTPVTSGYLIDAVAFSVGYGIVTDVESTGCPNGGASVSLATSNASVVAGRSIDTTLTISAGIGALLVGLSLDRADTDLTPLGMPGCTSRLGPTIAVQTVLPTPPVVPHAMWQIPAAPAFVGIPLFTQAAALAPGGGPPALSNSQGLRIGSSQVLPIKATMAFWTGSLYVQFANNSELVPVVRLGGTFP